MNLNLIVSSKALKLNHTVEVKLLNHPKIDGDLLIKIKQTIKEIFQKQYNNNQALTDKVLLEVSPTDMTITEKAIEEHKIAVKGQALDDLDVKVIRESKKIFPTLRRSIVEIYAGWQRSWKDRNFIIRFICFLVLFPLAVLYRSFSPKVYSLAEVRQLGNPHDEASLLTALKWGREACNMKVEEDPFFALGEEFTLSKQLEEAEQYGESFQKSSATVDFKAFAQKIEARLLKAKSERPGESINLALYPTGYWRQQKDSQVFEPMLLSFYCDEKGRLGLSEMGYNTKEKSVARHYAWDTTDQDSIEMLLKNLSYLSKQPKEEQKSPFTLLQETVKVMYLHHQTNDIQRHCDFLEKITKSCGDNGVTFASKFSQKIKESHIHKTLNNNGMTSPENWSIEELRQRLIMSTGAFEQINKEKIFLEDENPWKMVWQTIATQFPSADYADKLIFTSALLTNRFEKILSLLPYMEKKEKEQWLHLLERDRISFEQQLKCRFGKDNLTQEFGFTQDHPFMQLHLRFDQLQKEIELLHQKSPQAREERLSLLNSPKNDYGNLIIPQITLNKTKEKIAGAKLTESSLEDILLIKKLKKGWAEPTQENLLDTLDTFENLLKRMDKLLDEKSFVEVTQLYREILPFIPSPQANKEGTFWKLIAQQVQKDNSSVLFERVSGALSQLTHYTWETKLKLGDIPLKPDEDVYLQNVEVGIIQLYQLRTIWVDKVLKGKMASESVKEWYLVKNKMPLTFDDVVCWKIPLFLRNLPVSDSASIYNLPDADHLLQSRKNDHYLRPTLSSHLETLMIDIRDFLFTVPISSRKKYDFVSYYMQKDWDSKLEQVTEELIYIWYSYEKQYSRQAAEDELTKYYEIMNIPSGINPLYFHKESVMKGFFNPSHKNSVLNGCDFPSAITHLLRHQVMMSSLYFPETGIGEYLTTLDNFSLNFKKSIKDEWHGINACFIEARKNNLRKLSTLNRLDLISSYFRKQYIPLVHKGHFLSLGIREKNKDRFEMEINVRGVTDSFKERFVPLYQIGRDLINKKIYEESMGAPIKNKTSNAFISQTYDEEKNLREILNRPNHSMNPIESWFLNDLEVMLNPMLINNIILDHYENLEFFSPKNIEEVLDFALQNPHLLDNSEVQQKLVLVCFRTHLIPLLLRQNPEYFIDRAPKLKLLIEESANKGHYSRAAYLQWLCSLMHRHFEGASHQLEHDLKDLYQNFGDSYVDSYGEESKILNLDVPPLDKLKLQQILQEFPSMDQLLNTGNGKERKQEASLNLMLKWMNEGNPKAKADIGSYILHYWASHHKALTPEKYMDLNNTELLGALLSIGSFLQLHYSTLSTMPVVAQTGLLWLEERIVPCIKDSLSESKMAQNAILDAWISKRAGREIFSKSWSVSKEDPMIYESDEGSKLDLKNLQILAIQGQTIPPEKTALPSIILKSPDYMHLFGERNFEAETAMSEQRGEFIYKFTDEKGHPYRILFNRENQSVIIERQFGKEYCGANASGWYRFTKVPEPAPLSSESLLDKLPLGAFVHSMAKGSEILNRLQGKKEPEIPEIKGFEKIAVESGVWLHCEDSKKGLLLLQPSLIESTPQDCIQLQLDAKGKIKKAASTEGAIFWNDPELFKLLNPTHDSQILFLGNSRFVNEIRLIGQNITLKRSSYYAPWIVDSGPYRGMEWKIEGGDLSLSGLQKLGKSIEQFGMVLHDKKENKTHLLMWPQPLLTKKVHKISKGELLEFEKEPCNEAPLTLVFDHEGNISGSVSAYLYLAYLYGAKHDYARARHFMQKATTISVTEHDQIEKMRRLLSSWETPSLRSITLKLKGLLLTQKLLKNPSQSFENLRAMDELYEAYEERKAHPGYVKMAPTDSHLWDKELELTIEELELLKENRRCSLGFLLKNAQSQENLLLTEKTLWTGPLRQPSQLLSHFLIPQLLTTRKSAPKDLDEILKAPISGRFLMENFFSIWNLIIEKKWTSKEVIPLFFSLSKYDENAILAAKILIQLTVHHEKSEKKNIQPFDLVALEKSLQSSFSKLMNPLNIKETIKTILMNPLNIKENIKTVLMNPVKIKENIETIDLVLQETILDVALRLEEVFIDTKEPLQIGKTVVTSEQIDLDKETLSKRSAERKISLDKLALELKQNPEVFGKELSDNIISMIPVWQKNPDLPLSIFMKEVEDLLKVDVKIKLKESELECSISQLEKEQEGDFKSTWKNKSNLSLGHTVIFPKFDPFEAHFESGNAVDFSQKAKELSETFDLSLNEIERAENEKLRKGLELAGKSLTVQQQNDKKLKKDQLELIKLKIQAQLTKSSTIATEKKQHILRSMLQIENRDSLPKAVRVAVENIEVSGSNVLFNAALDAYQKGEFSNGYEKLEREITLFLVYQTEAQQLEQSLIKVQEIENFKEDPEEWDFLSGELHRLLKAGMNASRYLDDKNCLIDPQYSRKFLVAEHRLGIILREEQIQLIRNMVENPDRYYQLCVGLGKTSVIFPLVILLLMEKGIVPLALVPSSLYAQNRMALDRSTRLLQNSAIFEFSFTIDSPDDPLLLAEQYRQLLQVKKNKQYVLSTLDSLAAIDHKLILLQREQQHLMSHSEELLAHEESLLAIEKKIEWLAKIRKFLKGLQVIQDEADFQTDIRSENNLAIGENVALNPALYGMMEIILTTIFTSKNETLIQLKQTLQSFKQDALRPQDIKEVFIPTLVKELLSNQDFKAQIGCENPDSAASKRLKELKIEDWVQYICFELNSNQENPCGKWIDFEEGKEDLSLKKFQNGMAALKGFMQRAFTTALLQSPQLNIGFIENGPLVIPKTDPNGEEFRRFGDERDTLANYYLMYIVCGLPDSDFTQNALKALEVNEPEVYEKLKSEAYKAGKNSVFAYLNKKSNWAARMQFLRQQVIQQCLIKHYPKQHILNLQEIIGPQRGGMSGTLNPFTLPQTTGGQGDEMRTVEGTQFLLASAKGTPSVKAVNEHEILNDMIEQIKDLKCKALINQGCGLKGRDSHQIVAHLRKTEAGKQRIFVNVDPQSRMTTLWPLDKNAPQKMSKEQLKELLRDPQFRQLVVFVYNHPDTRGTDYDIPPGKVILYAGPGTDMAGNIQAWGRARGLGRKHRLEIVITKGFEERISHSFSTIVPLLQKKHQDADILFYDGINKEIMVVQVGSSKAKAIPKEELRKFVEASKQCCIYAVSKEEKKIFEMFLNEKNGVLIDKNPVNEIAFAQVLKDIENKTLHDQKGLNIKSAFHKITAVVPEGIRDLIHHFSYPGNSKEKLLTIKMRARLLEIAEKQSMIIKGKISDLKNDYTPTYLQPTVEKILETFDQEFQKIDIIENELKSELQKIEKESMEFVACYTEAMQKSFSRLRKAIEGQKQTFIDSEKNKEIYQNLPEKLTSSMNEKTNSLEQVQVQQQTQQQVQQEVQETVIEQQIEYGKVSKKIKPKRTDIWKLIKEVDSLDNKLITEVDFLSSNYLMKPRLQNVDFHPLTENFLSGDYWTKSRLQNVDFHPSRLGLFLEKTFVSDAAIELYKNFSILPGEPALRVLINGDRIILLTRWEYHYSVAKDLHALKGKNAVITLTNGAKDNGAGFMISQVGQEMPDFNDEKILRKIVQVKFVLGYYRYSDKEKELLKSWLSSLSRTELLKWTEEFCSKKGNREQIRFCKELCQEISREAYQENKKYFDTAISLHKPWLENRDLPECIELIKINNSLRYYGEYLSEFLKYQLQVLTNLRKEFVLKGAACDSIDNVLDDVKQRLRDIGESDECLEQENALIINEELKDESKNGDLRKELPLEEVIEIN